MTPVSADVFECGWRSFLMQDYESALVASLCVFGLNQSDFGSRESSIVQQLQKRDMDQLLQVDALELLVATGSALGKELDALDLFSRVIGLPIEFWDILEPLSAANTDSIQHSQLQEYVNAQAKISKFKKDNPKLTPDWQDATTPAAAEDLKLSFTMIYLLASRFGVNPTGLLSSEVRALWELFYGVTEEFGEQLGSQDAGILPIQSLGTVQQHRLRNLYIRSLSAAGFPFRSFALFRASYPGLFKKDEASGRIDPDTIRDFSASSGANDSSVDALWLSLSIAADRLHDTEWTAFATKLLVGQFFGGIEPLDNIELLADLLLSRPSHVIGESYHAVLSFLQASNSLTLAHSFARTVQNRLRANTDSISPHGLDIVVRVSEYWGFADKSLLEAFSTRPDRIAFPRALAGLPDLELLTRLKEYDFVDGKLGLKREHLFAKEAFVERSQFLLARIRFARDCLAAGRKSEAASAIHAGNERHKGWSFDAESAEFDRQLEDLWNATVISSQTASAIPQFCINLATLLRIARHEGHNDFAIRCQKSPRVVAAIGSIELDKRRQVMHPVHFAYALCACVECLDVSSQNFEDVCEAAVATILSLQDDSSLPTSNRKLISNSVRQLRLVLVQLVSNWPEDLPERAVSESRLILWIEMLEHTRVERPRKPSKAPNSDAVKASIVPPNSIGTDSNSVLEHKVATVAHISFSVENESVDESYGCDDIAEICNAEAKSNQRRKLIDELLNAACKVHRASISREFDLMPIVGLVDSGKSNLVFSLDGPLASCPIEWLKIGDQLLHEVVNSCTSTFSFRRSAELSASGLEFRSSNEIFFAAWESKDKPRARASFIKLNDDLHALAKENRWKCRSAFDSPKTTRELIENTLKAIPFSLIVVAGHGVSSVREGRYCYGVEVFCPDIKYTSLWDGRGDFHSAELVIVCSCVVGRLLDDNQGSVRGLYSDLLSNGAHAFCGARWAVDSNYAVEFTHRLTLELLSRLHRKDFSGPFRTAQLDALRVAWACIGVSELDWAPLELMVKLGEPTLSAIGRQGNANNVDNGTLSSISGTHLIAKQLGVARSILLGDQQEEQSSGVWGHLSKLSASFRCITARWPLGFLVSRTPT